jgi:hypothetical protein
VLAAAARAAASTPCGAGAERVLAELGRADAMPDDGWLRALAAFGAVHGGGRAHGHGSAGAIEALLLLRTERGPRRGARGAARPAIPSDSRGGSNRE